MQLPATTLDDDGERFLPSVRGAIRSEHVHRYAVCLPYVAGRRVLDVACGEGYGSALLAQNAASVIGVDLSLRAIGHAQATYRAQNLRFEVGEATALPLPDASVDVAVSFETIEHLADHAGMLSELRRVMAKNGVLIISSPNKAIYSDLHGLVNPYHVHELHVGEFEALLQTRFRHVALFGQRLVTSSLLVRLDSAAAGSLIGLHGTPARIERNVPALLPMYVVAVCSDAALEIAGLESLYLDDEQDLIAETKAEVDRALDLLTRARRRADLRALAPHVPKIDLDALVDTTNAAGALDIIEDEYSGLRLSGPLAIGTQVNLVLTGWALVDGIAAEICITLDGMVVAGATPIARPDVAAVHGDAAALAGFAASIVTGVGSGAHEIEVRAFDRTLLRQSRLATIQLQAIDLNGLTSTQTLHLDTPVVHDKPAGASQILESTDILRVRGWGFDDARRERFVAVALLVDERTVVPLPYGAQRPDVAAAFSLRETELGIDSEILGETFGPGKHSVRLIGVATGGEAYVSSGAVELGVRGATALAGNSTALAQCSS